MLTPDDLFDHANKAFQVNSSREVFARSGISRAYYACYHYCLNAANNWCSPLPKEQKQDAGNHEQLIRRLKSQGRHQPAKAHLTTLADMLHRARDLRVDADYHLDSAVGQDEYYKALKFGREIQKKVSEIAKSIDGI